MRTVKNTVTGNRFQAVNICWAADKPLKSAKRLINHALENQVSVRRLAVPHRSKYNAEQGIIEIVYEGLITLDEIVEVSREIPKLMLENHCFMTLGDYRAAKVSLTTLEIYQLPAHIGRILQSHGLSPAEMLRAFVVDDGLDDFFLRPLPATTAKKPGYLKRFQKPLSG